jgi:hypothetical protein
MIAILFRTKVEAVVVSDFSIGASGDGYACSGKLKDVGVGSAHAGCTGRVTGVS